MREAMHLIRRTVVLGILLLGLVALLPAIASAQGPGNSEAAKACQGDGYLNWVRAPEDGGTGFANVGECVNYVAIGETLAVPAPALTPCEQEAVAHDLDPSTFDAIFEGTEGHDYWPTSALTPGPDLFCGFGGYDRVLVLETGDVFLGGLEDDSVDSLGGGTMGGGTFYGGPGNDVILTMRGDVFYGGTGDDLVRSLLGGTFYGGPGSDVVNTLEANATFDGGEDTDQVDVNFGGTLINVP